MMAHADLAALLALGAALFIGIGDVMHQRTAHAVSDQPVGHLSLFLTLLRDRGWWLGSGVAAIGFGLQAAALGLGSVLLVQSLLVTSLLFALVINARVTGRQVRRREWIWAALLAASVALIVVAGNPTAGQSRADGDTWLVVLAVLGPIVLACLIGARRWPGSPAAVLLAFVSGALWGVFAVLTKGVVATLGHGVAAVLTAPELYAWALVAVAATAWQQSAFRAGALTASLPTMTVAEPVVAAILGVVVLGETMQPGERGWFALVAAIAVMVVSTAALARGEADTGESEPTGDAVAPTSSG